MIDHFRHPRNLASAKGGRSTGNANAGARESRGTPSAGDRHRPIRYQSYRVEPPPPEGHPRAHQDEYVDLTERADRGLSEASIPAPGRAPDPSSAPPVGASLGRSPDSVGNSPRATPWHAPSARREDDPSVTPAQDASREASRGGVVHALREAAKQSGLDPIAELYNEALRYANENHLRLARERLQILLCMAPDDAEARLTLARVYAAESRWAEALAELDLAHSCGFDVPMSLRKAVEDHLRAEKARTDKATDDLSRRPSRERDEGEVRSLRQEAKRLRTENAQHTARVAQLEREVRRWAWLTAALSTLAIGFIGVTLTFGTDAADGQRTHSRAATEASSTLSHAAIPTPAGPAQVAATKTETATPAARPGLVDTALASRVESVIAATPGAEGLTVQIANGTVVLSGSVARYRELKVVLDTMKTWPTPPRVDYTTVDVRVRRVGARHTVAAAENLSQIALDYYGSANHAKLIEARNDLIGKPLPSGAELELPPLPEKF